MAKKKNYINRDVYHAEMVACKRNGNLSDKALKLIRLHIDKVSLKYSASYESEEEREDCMSSAMMDILQYWKNFKESNVTQFKMIRNATPNDEIIVTGKGGFNLIIHFHNGETVIKDNEIVAKIRSTRNRTISSMADAVNEQYGSMLQVTVDKMKRKITIQDVTEAQTMDEVVVKMVNVMTPLNTKEGNPKSPMVYQMVKNRWENDILEYLTEKGMELKSEKEIHDFMMDNDIKLKIPLTDASENGIIKFDEPGNCFSYFTSVIRNGILKEFKKKSRSAHVPIGTGKGEIYSI